MAYQKLNWLNKGETGAIPINKTNLNHMDDGIEQNSNDIANIIESGSNDNGSWVKYSDGTMICWRQETVTDQAINNEYGSVFIGTRSFTYPIPFSTIPSLTCTSFRYGTSASWGAVVDTSTTTAVLRGFDFFSRASGEDCLIGYIAIGKWK